MIAYAVVGGKRREITRNFFPDQILSLFVFMPTGNYGISYRGCSSVVDVGCHDVSSSGF